jgi:hypothetical protein
MSTSFRSFAALAVGLLAGSLLSAQGESGQEPGSPSGTKAEREILAEIEKVKAETSDLRTELLRGLRLDGQPIDPAKLRRETVYLAGTNLIELKILEFIVDEWRDRMIKDEGKDPADFAVDDTEVEKELRANLNTFAVQHPGLDFWEVVRAQTGIPREQYVRQRKVTMLFDKVFFPGPAENWPAITQEAIKAGSKGAQGGDFMEGLKKNETIPPFFLDMVRKMLITQLKDWSVIRYSSDGLPPSIVLEVNERQWPTDEAFEQVKAGLFIQDMEKAVSEILIREALSRELEKHDALLGDAEFTAQFAEYRKQFDNTLFNTEMIARAFKGYPTLEAFRSRWRLMQSFENMIAKRINDDALKAHAEAHSRFFSDGSVNVDVIAFMGRDRRSGVWVPGGMAAAKQRAIECKELIDSGKWTFDQALEAKGEYFDNVDKERGRLGKKPLNELRRSLHESEYTDLLHGFSLAYHLFYEAEVGKVTEPLKGPEAWYIARVNQQGPASGPTDIRNARTRDLVKQDFLTHEFFEWSKDVMSRVKVSRGE